MDKGCCVYSVILGAERTDLGHPRDNSAHETRNVQPLCWPGTDYHQTTPLVQPHQTTNLSETTQHPEASWIPYPHQAKSSHTVNHASLAVLFLLSIIQGLICLSIEMLPVSPIMVKAASSSRSVHRQISNQWVFSLKSRNSHLAFGKKIRLE